MGEMREQAQLPSVVPSHLKNGIRYRSRFTDVWEISFLFLFFLQLAWGLIWKRLKDPNYFGRLVLEKNKTKQQQKKLLHIEGVFWFSCYYSGLIHPTCKLNINADLVFLLMHTTSAVWGGQSFDHKQPVNHWFCFSSYKMHYMQHSVKPN